MKDDITSPRPQKKPSSVNRLTRKPMGEVAPPELVERALGVYEGGVKCGMHGLATRLDCSHALALDCIGQLRLAGRIRNDREVFRAVIPHPGKRAA